VINLPTFSSGYYRRYWRNEARSGAS